MASGLAEGHERHLVPIRKRDRCQSIDSCVFREGGGTFRGANRVRLDSETGARTTGANHNSDIVVVLGERTRAE